MISTPPGIEIEIIWLDEHMIELQVTASNSRWSGKTTFYAGFEGPKDFAKQISGFPSSKSDSREFAFGGTDLIGYGEARFQFGSMDNLGHLVLSVVIQENSQRFQRRIESVGLCIPIEPAGVDSFVEQLNRMEVKVGERAFLAMAT